MEARALVCACSAASGCPGGGGARVGVGDAKIHTETASGQKAPGTLSRVIEPLVSRPPKKKARQLVAIDRIAAL
jgi:hypothetical protein